MLSTANDIRFKCFREISSWTQDEWHLCMKKLSINNCGVNSDNSENVSNMSNDSETACNDCACDESTHTFMESEEDLHEFKKLNDEQNKDNSNGNNKTCRKILFGGPSEETSMALLHPLNSFSGKTIHLLTVKGFNYVLTWKISNDPIEHRFSMNACLSGNYLALDASTFAYDERTLLLKLVSHLCENVDASHNKILCKSFFNGTQSIVKKSEAIEVIKWRQKWSYLTTVCSDMVKINEILDHNITPHIDGLGIKKLIDRTPVKCQVCLNKLTHVFCQEFDAMTKIKYHVIYNMLTWETKEV